MIHCFNDRWAKHRAVDVSQSVHVEIFISSFNFLQNIVTSLSHTYLVQMRCFFLKFSKILIPQYVTFFCIFYMNINFEQNKFPNFKSNHFGGHFGAQMISNKKVLNTKIDVLIHIYNCYLELLCI